MYKYDLGIIGGMGSEATVEIYKRIVERTKHTCDQDHMKICILNNSIIPDRTASILNGEEDPSPYLQESINELIKVNCKYFIMACNTAHYFVSFLKYENINFINMIEESLEYIRKNYNDKKICILSTKGTIQSKVYHNNIKAKDFSFVYANEDEQNKIMNIITNTKKGFDRESLSKELELIVENIYNREDNCVFVIACTELSLYKSNLEKKYILVDAMDCLVNSSIIKCGYQLKS